MNSIDFAGINAAARPALPALLASWVPGKRQGQEWVGRNPTRADKSPGSFSIHLGTGAWSDFATGDKGGDPISLLAYINGSSQGDAARALAEQLGIDTDAAADTVDTSRIDLWLPIVPAPNDAPKLTNLVVQRFARPGFKYTDAYPYTSATKQILGWIVRYESPPNGHRPKKEYRPFVFCEGPDGRREWRCQGLPEPRPLYGLFKLADRPDAPVLVTEGEKACKAAAKLLPDHIVVTSPNGSRSAGKADWAPLKGRDVTIWPDYDAPGLQYAAEVAELARRAGATSVSTVRLPGGLPEGWDLADDLPAGLTPADIVRVVAQAQQPAAAGATDRQGWQEPKPLPSGLLQVKAFDADLIPVSIGPWVADIADRMQCPPDFVAIPAVVALASTLGRKIAVRPQAKTDWVEVPNLWGCIVGRPGTMKSPAMAEALKPLNWLEAEARKVNEEELRRYGIETAAYKLRQEEGQKAARASIKAGSHDVADLLDLDEPQKPMARRFIVGDTTYEALGEILASNPNGILAFRDELTSLLKTLDREEYVNARGFFLTGWNGTSGYPFDRIGRGSSYIEAVCISLLGSTQPGRLSEYLSRVIQDTAGNDGLLQRFALLVWPDDNGAWRPVDRYADSQARTTAWDTFTRLHLLRPDDVGATQGEYDAIPSLRLDDTARGVFGEWRADLESRLRSGGMHSALESHLAKYRKLVPTLSLLNHLADGGHGPVNEVAVLRAIAFADYLESHAKRAYGSGTQLETATAKAILARIHKGDLAGQFTARDIQRHDWSNLCDRDQIAAGLDLLDDLDWIRGAKTTTGGRPKTSYTINPRGLG